MSYHPTAFKLGDTFHLKPLLMQRGLVVESTGKVEQTFYEQLKKQVGLSEDDFYKLMDDNENRKKIRKMLMENQGKVDIGKLSIALTKDEEMKFTSAFEWYVSKILENEFSFFVTGFNNKIAGADKGTDFDVLGLGLDLFAHIECKTGNPRNLTKANVVEFKNKCHQVSADINIFYVDYNGLDYNSHEILQLFPEIFFEGSKSELLKISKTDKAFEIYKVDIAPVFIVDTNKNSKSVVENFREVFKVYFKLRYLEMLSAGLSVDSLKTYGYAVESFSKK